MASLDYLMKTPKHYMTTIAFVLGLPLIGTMDIEITRFVAVPCCHQKQIV